MAYQNDASRKALYTLICVVLVELCCQAQQQPVMRLSRNKLTRTVSHLTAHVKLLVNTYSKKLLLRIPFLVTSDAAD